MRSGNGKSLLLAAVLLSISVPAFAEEEGREAAEERSGPEVVEEERVEEESRSNGWSDARGMSRREAIEEFGERMLVFETRSYVTVDQYGRSRGPSQDEMRFYRGRYKVPMTIGEFLVAVDQEEYTERHEELMDKRRNRFLAAGVIAGGSLVAALAGTAILFSGTESAGLQNVGLGLLGGGIFVGLTVPLVPCMMGAATDTTPFQAHEARRLVDEYNRELLRELGLEAEELKEEEGGGFDGLRVHLYSNGETRGVGLGFRF